MGEHRKQLRRYDGLGHARGLTWSCFAKRPFLQSERACNWLVDSIQRAQHKHVFHVWAYCFMPNHAHLVILPSKDSPPMKIIVAAVKHGVARTAVRWTKMNAPDKLHLMQDVSTTRPALRFWLPGGGYDRNLWSPRAIWRAIHYIHRNPVTANLCERGRDWRWSSAAYFAGAGPSVIQLDHTHLPADPGTQTRTFT